MAIEENPRALSVLISELSIILQEQADSNSRRLEPSGRLCGALEIVMPNMLKAEYAEWNGETLDGVFVAKATHARDLTLALVGTCILMSDQTRAPFYATLTLSPSRDTVSRYEVLLGEPGGGRLGVSGPATNSDKASRLHDGVVTRCMSGEVAWVYRASSKETDHSVDPERH